MKIKVYEFSQQNYAFRSVNMGEKFLGEFDAHIVVKHTYGCCPPIQTLELVIEGLESVEFARSVYWKVGEEDGLRNTCLTKGHRISVYTHNPDQGIAWGYYIERI